jgi:hypothetical protein
MPDEPTTGLTDSPPAGLPERLPDSGDGLAPPEPEALPHPALWSTPPPGQAPVAYDGQAEDDADVPARTRSHTIATWASVGGMLLGAVLLALAFVLQSWPLAVAGLVVGAAGAVGALKVKILTAVSVGQSPHGPG